MQKHPDVPSEETVDGAAFDQERAREFTTNWARRLRGKLFYWWSLFVAAALLLIFGPPVLLVSLLANRPEWIYPWAHWGARNWLRLSGVEVIVRGREQLDPNQTYIFISNHRSYLDTATLFCYAGRPIGILAKKELTKIPILGQGMIYVGVVPIDRSNRARAIETLRQATAKVRAGQSFGIFAEGTRALPGQLLPFKKGPFYMAIEAGVPIVPIAMKNTDQLMGKGTGMARPGTIEMVFLPPVSTQGLSTEEDVERLAHHVREMIAEELRR
ncbi:MAG: hypothetical protein C4334_13520 [Pyrinomonas sp.]|uniref:lysophospholipid acyltransferase family protein n=1 Tax=Pyrinomonas sp. TaxID=2080306 RepID=UPI00332263C0